MLELFSSSKEEKNCLLTDSAGETLFAECAEDFVLPDYLPEIRKLIRVDALPVSTGHFVGSEEVEFAGQVRYTLLYTDAEGKLTSVPLHTDNGYRLIQRSKVPGIRGPVHLPVSIESTDMFFQNGRKDLKFLC
jgi:hypothetical protein